MIESTENNSINTQNKENIAKLAKKLLNITSEIETVQKRGYNSFHKYYYSTESDIIEAVKKLLVKYGVMILTSTNGQNIQPIVKTDNKSNGYITQLSVLYTIIDTDTGEYFTVNGEGQGHDQLDKGIAKANTLAFKYLFSKLFMIETGDDPEKDNLADSKTTNTLQVNKLNSPKKSLLLTKKEKANY